MDLRIGERVTAAQPRPITLLPRYIPTPPLLVALIVSSPLLQAPPPPPHPPTLQRPDPTPLPAGGFGPPTLTREVCDTQKAERSTPQLCG